MSVQTHSIDPPIYGRYVRIIPRGWRSHISMRLELYGGPWSKWYSSSFLKWKINEFTLKVRNDTTVGPPLTATSLRRPFFFGGGGGKGGQSMYSLFFQPLYNGLFWGGGGGAGSPCIHSSFNLSRMATFFCSQGGCCAEVLLYVLAD